jgi:hypothetical protein
MLDMRFHLYFTPGYTVTNSEFVVAPKLVLTSVKVAVSIISSIAFRNVQQIPKCIVTYLGYCVAIDGILICEWIY